MLTTPMTEENRTEAVEAFHGFQSECQTIGVLGFKLRRTKPGTKKHQEYMAAYDRMLDKVATRAGKIGFFLRCARLSDV